jgi:hypothetical protein
VIDTLDAGTQDAAPDAPDARAGDGAAAEDARITPPFDAGKDALDARPDVDTGTGDPLEDASIPDASASGQEPYDGGSEPDGGYSPECSADDLAAWQAFHLSTDLVQEIGDCIAADPSCLLGSCPLDDCLRQQAGVVGCQDCVRAEVRCVADACTDACGTSDGNDACRACVCAHGCVDTFQTCAGTTLDVCSDCNGTTCANTSLSPALIMVIVNSVLL